MKIFQKLKRKKKLKPHGSKNIYFSFIKESGNFEVVYIYIGKAKSFKAKALKYIILVVLRRICVMKSKAK